MKVRKVNNPLFVKVLMGGKTLLSVGSPKSVCDTFDISVPQFTNNIPILLEGKLKGSKAKIIDSAEFKSIYRRVGDSRGSVILI